MNVADGWTDRNAILYTCTVLDNNRNSTNMQYWATYNMTSFIPMLRTTVSCHSKLLQLLLQYLLETRMQALEQFLSTQMHDNTIYH